MQDNNINRVAAYKYPLVSFSEKEVWLSMQLVLCGFLPSLGIGSYTQPLLIYVSFSNKYRKVAIFWNIYF